MPNQFFKPKEERSGLNITSSDNGGEVKNKIFIAIIIAGLIIGGAIYLGLNKTDKGNEIDKEETPAKQCLNLPDLPDGTFKIATKVIDGDTFLIEGGYSVRILGIDADERGYPCYQVAKEGLEKLILKKNLKLEKGVEDYDQYCRYLRYPFFNDENISLKMIEQGLAVARFSPEDIKYREEISLAEKKARQEGIGCEWSTSGRTTAENKGDEEVKMEFNWQNLTPETTGLEVVEVCQAGNYYGKEMIVEGRVADTYRSKTNTIFLNFEKPYPNHCFVSVLFSSDQYKFVQNPEDYYLNQVVRIKGEIKEYQGKPEIILKDPSQIEIGK